MVTDDAFNLLGRYFICLLDVFKIIFLLFEFILLVLFLFMN